MNVLILSGEVLEARPISYGLPSDWNVKTIDILNGQLQALLEKFESPHDIPLEEVAPALRAACSDVTEALSGFKPHVIIGTEMGADVLATLRARAEWSGPSVIIGPMGYFRHFPNAPRRSAQVGSYTDAVWIVRSQSHGRGAPKSIVPKGKSAVVVQVRDLSGLYVTSFLQGCVSLCKCSDEELHFNR